MVNIYCFRYKSFVSGIWALTARVILDHNRFFRMVGTSRAFGGIAGQWKIAPQSGRIAGQLPVAPQFFQENRMSQLGRRVFIFSCSVSGMGDATHF